MKKTDLARRADRAGDRYLRTTQQDYGLLGSSYACGFEYGYRAARSDLRRIMNCNRIAENPAQRHASIVGSVWQWLKPIR